ncbi:MAG: phosphatase PAP2 family protein [Saprospiraceae bacterium]|nr:phosphatase PAP2 family protein [Saprospiraceae bacterium]
MGLKALVIYSLVVVFLWIGTLALLQRLPIGSELDFIQTMRSPARDQVFKWVTRLGEIWLYLLLAILYVSRREYTKLKQLGLLGILVVVISIGLKYYFAQPRPALAWAGFSAMKGIPGVQWMATWDSFPSGHTMSAIVLAGWLAWEGRNGWVAALLAVMAGMVGLSRIYLAEHFLKDVSMGMITGLALVWVFYRVLWSMKRERFHSG